MLLADSYVASDAGSGFPNQSFHLRRRSSNYCCGCRRRGFLPDWRDCVFHDKSPDPADKIRRGL